jgi:hypothetical protein
MDPSGNTLRTEVCVPKFRNQTEVVFWASVILFPISAHAPLRSGENFFSCHGVPSFFFLGIPNLCAI